MKSLKERYGDENKLAQHYIKELENWPRIPSEDGKALEKFSFFLTECGNLMKSMSPLNQLNSTRELELIMAKLPNDLRKAWRDRSYAFHKNKEVITFCHLQEFVEQKADMLNMSSFTKVYEDKNDKKNSKPFNKRSFATSTGSSNRPPLEKKCFFCSSKDHQLDLCEAFMKTPLNKRQDFIKSSKLCFGCLGTNHSSKFCKKRAVCRICKGRHPTCLHRHGSATSAQANTIKPSESVPSTEERKEKTTSQKEELQEKKAHASLNRSAQSQKVICPAVPVKICARGSNVSLETYIGLDHWATDCFIDDDLLTKLGIQGEKTTISLTTMENSRSRFETKMVRNLEITTLDGARMHLVSCLYSKKDWPFTFDDSPHPEDIEGCNHFKDIPFNFIRQKIGILIGMNQSELLKLLRVISGADDEPFATKHKLGWAINGLLANRPGTLSSIYRISVQHNQELENQIDSLHAQDFVDEHIGEKGPLQDDRKWMELVRNGTKRLDNGHFKIALTFKSSLFVLSNNFYQVSARLKCLKKRMSQNPDFKTDYCEFMNELLKSGYMEQVPDEELEKPLGKVWYLTHHGVYHKRKKKIRVVLDASLKYHGISMNDQLFQGPDLTANLLGVLLRFRQHQFAVSGDIEKMFLQVKVPQEHADLQRIVWYPDGNTEREPIQYRLTTHVFGAVSSPSCANYALRQTAVIHPDIQTEEARDSVIRDFYVDDYMKSVEDESHAIDLVHEVRGMLKQGGFNLTNFCSNSRSLLSSFAPELLAKELRKIDIDKDSLPKDRALGVSWNVEMDNFGYDVNLESQPCTRRTILSTVASLYDPLGLVAPVIVYAKMIFQESCTLGTWDTPITGNLCQAWEKWISDLHKLANYGVPRCLGVKNAGVSHAELHIFCDGSEKAYGAVAYARCLEDDGIVHCNIIMAKSRLVPLKKNTLKTIPRIELNAARLAVQVYLILKRELTISFQREWFWSDSATVLAYLKNKSACYQRFVAHRVEYILEHTKIEQWHYVPSKENAADIISKGCSVDNFLQLQNWKTGPSFLKTESKHWTFEKSVSLPDENELEIKQTPAVVGATRLHENRAAEQLLQSTGDWFRMRLRVAAFRKFISYLKNKDVSLEKISCQDVDAAEIAILKFLQKKNYGNELESLKSGKQIPLKSTLKSLFPFLHDDDLLRVGGRLRNALVPFEAKHPVILPSNEHVVQSLIRNVHLREGHQGCQHVLAELRLKYWIIKSNSTVKKVLQDCIDCKRRNAQPSRQLMAPLPDDRVIGCKPPFTATGIDYLGPFLVHHSRKSNIKRYGVVFSCLASRAIHLEVATSLDVDSFLNAFRRFAARRGNLSVVYSDNGTNLVAGNKELKKELRKWCQQTIEKEAMEKGIDWKFRPPLASHYGGFYEREIRSIRKVLDAIVQEHKVRLDMDSLNTFMCEVEAILNNRPLFPLTDDPQDLDPLTPNHLLRLNTAIPFPPCVTEKADVYGRRRWRQVQHLADVFWSRWTREYLPLLQSRQKWKNSQRCHQVGDMVLLVDQLLPRNQWCIGRIIETYPSSDGLIRRVKVRVSRCKEGSKMKIGVAELDRPISKLVLLRANDSSAEESEE